MTISLWKIFALKHIIFQEDSVLLPVCYYHVTYAFQSETTLYTYLNVKELLVRNRRDVWSLSDSNGIRTHNHLVRKRTLNYLAKLAVWLASLAKWLNVRLRTKWLRFGIPLLSLKLCSIIYESEGISSCEWNKWMKYCRPQITTECIMA